MRDDDEHVRVRDHFESKLRVMLAVRFTEDARARCDQAKERIERAKHALVDAHEHAAKMLDYLERANDVAEQALRLHAMRRL